MEPCGSTRPFEAVVLFGTSDDRLLRRKRKQAVMEENPNFEMGGRELHFFVFFKYDANFIFIGGLTSSLSALVIGRKLQSPVTTLEIFRERIGTKCSHFSPGRSCVTFHRA